MIREAKGSYASMRRRWDRNLRSSYDHLSYHIHVFFVLYYIDYESIEGKQTISMSTIKESTILTIHHRNKAWNIQ